jgi:hypothetical protein
VDHATEEEGALAEKRKKRAAGRSRKAKRKSKRSKSTPRESERAKRDPSELQDWCTNPCGAEEAFRGLCQLVRLLGDALERGRITASEIEGINLDHLSSMLAHVNCRRLDALAIDILKRAAFVEGSDRKDFVWNCYTVMFRIWNDRHRHEVNRVPSYERCRRDRPDAPCAGEKGVDPVFDEEKLLEAWTSDLPWIRPKSLWSYVHVLGCEGLSDNPRFDDAVAEFKKHVVECVLPWDPVEAARAGTAFARGVLAPLLEVDASAVVRCLPEATDILANTAFSEKNRKDGVRKLEALSELASQLRAVLKGKDVPVGQGEDNETTDAFSTSYRLLSEACSSLPEGLRRRIGGLLETLMPTLGLWERRPARRKAPDGTELRLELPVNGDTHSLNGEVVDFCKIRNAAHVRFADLKECAVVLNSGKGIPGEDIHSVLLKVEHEQHGRLLFRDVVGHLSLPTKGYRGKKVSVPCKAWPVRGWRYEPPSLGCGAIFLLQGVREQLAPRVDSMKTVLYHESSARRSAFTGETTLPEIPTAMPAATRGGIGDGAAIDCILRRKGAKWEASYAGRQVFIDHSKGVAYIARLLDKPRQSFHAAELRSLVRGKSESPELGSGDELIDEEALADFSRRLHESEGELREARASNDLGRIEQLEEERDAILQEVENSGGIGLKKRSFANYRKRATQSVSKASQRGLEAIRQEHEELWRHLDRSLKTGEFLSYDPETDVIWSVSWE